MLMNLVKGKVFWANGVELIAMATSAVSAFISMATSKNASLLIASSQNLQTPIANNQKLAHTLNYHLI